MNKEKINEFINRVFPIYEFLDWKWGGEKVTKKEIRKTLSSLIKTVVSNKDCSYSSTGGLYASREYDGEYEMITYGFKIDEYYEI